MKFCCETNSTLPKQCQRSRSILQNGSRTFGLFWKEKTLSYNRRNTVYLSVLEIITNFFAHYKYLLPGIKDSSKLTYLVANIGGCTTAYLPPIIRSMTKQNSIWSKALVMSNKQKNYFSKNWFVLPRYYFQNRIPR